MSETNVADESSTVADLYEITKFHEKDNLLMLDYTGCLRGFLFNKQHGTATRVSPIGHGAILRSCMEKFALEERDGVHRVVLYYAGRGGPRTCVIGTTVDPEDASEWVEKANEVLERTKPV